MPNKSPHPCNFQGCPNLAARGERYCPRHQKDAPPVRTEDTRESAALRGYGHRWQKLRTLFLAQHPLCADPFGDHARAGRVEAATDVHHIRARRDGGTDDENNLQALCHACHSRLTMSGA